MATRISQGQYAALVGVSRQAVVQAIRCGEVLDDGGVDVDEPSAIAYAEMITERRAERGHPPAPWADGERVPPPYGKAGRPRKDAPPRPPAPPRARPTSKPPKVKPRSPTPPVQTPANVGPAPIPESPMSPQPPARTGSPIGSTPASKANDKIVHLISATTKEIDQKIKDVKLHSDRMRLRRERRKLILTSMVASMLGKIGSVLEDHFRSFGDRNAAAIVAAVQAGGAEPVVTEMLDTEVDKAIHGIKLTIDREIARLALDTTPGGEQQ